jgi:hypothetical protein
MTLDLFDFALLALAGFASGWVNVLAGGGSIFTVPVMVFLGMPGPVANGTNRIAIIAQNLTAVGAFFRSGFSNLKLSATLAAAASLGAYFGATVGVELEGEWFDRTVALVMVAVGLAMALDRGVQDDEARKTAPARNLLAGHALMAAAGFWGGFIQIGVGFLMMPILYRVMGLDLVRVNMHKVFIALIFSFVALGVFASDVAIAWEAGVALAIGNAFGGYLGARAAIRKGAPLIKVALYVMIAAMAAVLVLL